LRQNGIRLFPRGRNADRSVHIYRTTNAPRATIAPYRNTNGWRSDKADTRASTITSAATDTLRKDAVRFISRR
jgi:hypothetical protein